LRELQKQSFLDELLEILNSEREKLSVTWHKKVPLLVKTVIDLTERETETLVKILLKHHVDGIITSNTTVSRDGVEQLPHADEQGGLSGAPLCNSVIQMIHRIRHLSGNQLPIISVGGILSAEDAKAHLAAGASLVQIYTG